MAKCGCGKSHFFAPKCKICDAKSAFLIGPTHLCLACCDLMMHVLCASCDGKNRFITNYPHRTVTCAHCGAYFDFTKPAKFVPKNVVTE